MDANNATTCLCDAVAPPCTEASTPHVASMPLGLTRLMWRRCLTLVVALSLGALVATGCTGLIGADEQGGGDDDGPGPSGFTPDDFDDETEFVAPDLDEEQFEVTTDPGTRTLQRLNNTEYNNTLQHLLGTTATPADDFPTDDRGYGYDHIADVLSISPLHVELYDRSAESLIDEVMFLDTTVSNIWAFPADAPEVSQSTGGSASNGGWNIWSNGTVSTVINLESTGRYRISTRAFQQQAGPEDAQMTFEVDGAVVDNRHRVADVGHSLRGRSPDQRRCARDRGRLHQ